MDLFLPYFSFSRECNIDSTNYPRFNISIDSLACFVFRLPVCLSVQYKAGHSKTSHLAPAGNFFYPKLSQFRTSGSVDAPHMMHCNPCRKRRHNQCDQLCYFEPNTNVA